MSDRTRNFVIALAVILLVVGVAATQQQEYKVTGASTAITGTVYDAVPSNLSFSTPKTIVVMENRTALYGAGWPVYFLINATGATTTTHDFVLDPGENCRWDDLKIVNVSVYVSTTTGISPVLGVSIRGW